jgi:acetyl esterase/lipase
MWSVAEGSVGGSGRVIAVVAVVVGMAGLTARASQPGPDLSRMAVLRDIEYVPGGHERQKLDLYLPKAGEVRSESSGRRPLIVWIHGGAWQSGSKDRPPALRLVEKGYAVASINYRLSQHAIFPAQIEDCKAAIRWLRMNAGKYGYDPNRVGVWGASAGGHLVALLGTTGGVKEFDVGPNTGLSSRVQAVCDFFGPTDFAKIGSFPSTMRHDAADSPESKLVGGPIQENKDKAQRANPIAYVTKDDPPFLIVHGDKDPLVPHNQSEILYDALKKAGVEATLYTVHGGGHGGFKDPQVDVLVAQFFDKHLRN